MMRLIAQCLRTTQETLCPLMGASQRTRYLRGHEMNIISDTLEPLIERWEDPGDYPSGAGSGPLSSYDYLADLEGELKIELSGAEYQKMLFWGVDDWMAEVMDYDLPDGLLSVKWQFSAEGGKWRWQNLWQHRNAAVVTVWAEEIESDPNWQQEAYFDDDMI